MAEYVIGFIGFYFLSLGILINCKDPLSKMIFKLIPVLSGFFLIAHVAKTIGLLDFLG